VLGFAYSTSTGTLRAYRNGSLVPLTFLTLAAHSTGSRLA